MIRIGDYVRALDQDVRGQVIEIRQSSLVIIDDDSELDYPDSCKEYTVNQVEFLA